MADPSRCPCDEQRAASGRGLLGDEPLPATGARERAQIRRGTLAPCQVTRRRSAGLASLEALLLEVRDHLRLVQRSLHEEIRDYPTPIPRCDAQFNHLFDQRGRLQRALERIEAAAARSVARVERIALLEEFVASPVYMEAAAEGEIRARVRAELSRLSR
jgi:hypothetical protein